MASVPVMAIKCKRSNKIIKKNTENNQENYLVEKYGK